AADPSWFGLLLTVREDTPFTRQELVGYLEEREIQTRQLFAGNLLRQPAFQNVPSRTVGDLATTDKLMKDAFFIGVYPGLTTTMLTYVEEVFADFFRALRADGCAPAADRLNGRFPGRLTALPQSLCPNSRSVE